MTSAVQLSAIFHQPIVKLIVILTVVVTIATAVIVPVSIILTPSMFCLLNHNNYIIQIRILRVSLKVGIVFS
jgi:hypothetical protein